MQQHHYTTSLEWTGNTGQGTSNYRSYARDHVLEVAGKAQPILGASDPSFRGDPTRYNPEELFLASLSACHMLWYLHLCSANGVVVTAYTDQATGTMEETANGGGRFTTVTLHPQVKVQNSAMVQRAHELHAEANQLCFIANSCNFEVSHAPQVTVAL
ncbi:MAG: OsmC family protein [Bacteroidota bacterium]